MVELRTGLALENIEALKKEEETVSGITAEEYDFSAGKVTRVHIESDAAAQKIGREKGRYITIQFEKVQNLEEAAFEAAVRQTAKEISDLCQFAPDDTVLVAALGNEGITPDALGPKCLDHLLVTRQLERVAPEMLGENKLRCVAGIATNVFGVTGIESVEMVRGIASDLRPRWIIVIDALATGDMSRLCKTVQISDTAISPGGGVQNHRPTLSEDAVDARMISIGMPTVIDAGTLLCLFCDTLGISADEQMEKVLHPFSDSLIAMPSQIDSAVAAGAKLLAFSLNRALHFEMETADMMKYLA